jgi:hypothetical protein
MHHESFNFKAYNIIRLPNKSFAGCSAYCRKRNPIRFGVDEYLIIPHPCKCTVSKPAEVNSFLFCCLLFDSTYPLVIKPPLLTDSQKAKL